MKENIIVNNLAPVIILHYVDMIILRLMECL